MKRRKDSDLRKVLGGVLDERTLKSLYKLSRKLKLDAFYGFIKQGKESSVMLADTEDGKIVAVKVYAVESLDFKKIKSYLHMDHRFERVKGTNWSIVTFWAKREFKNLHTAKNAMVNCPEPIGVLENVLVMEFLGEGTEAAPRLVDCDVDKSMGEKLIEQMRRLYQAGLVHGDLSGYNILVHNGEPFLIDFSHGTSVKSRAAEDLLKRDVENMAKYLNKIGFMITEEDLMKRVKG